MFLIPIFCSTSVPFLTSFYEKFFLKFSVFTVSISFLHRFSWTHSSWAFILLLHWNCSCQIHQKSLSSQIMGFPVVQMVKNLPAIQKTQVLSLVWEDPLKKGMATHSSIPWGCNESDTTELITHSQIKFTSQFSFSAAFDTFAMVSDTIVSWHWPLPPTCSPLLDPFFFFYSKLWDFAGFSLSHYLLSQP